jgi:hypothetical protein
MTNDIFVIYAANWNTYQDAWADISLIERQALLARVVTDDCTFQSPSGEGQGREALLTHIDAFQTQFPGASFRTHTILSHHAQALAEWVMYDKEGSEFLPGRSYARFTDDGRISHLVGFWQL